MAGPETCMAVSRRRPGAPAGMHPALLAALRMAVLAVMAVQIPGCAGKDGRQRVVVQVGPRAVTSSEFRAAFADQMASDTTLHADSTGLRRFLAKYGDQVLLEVMAQDSIPTLEGVPKSNYEEFRANLLVQALHDQAYGKATQVSEKDVRQAYDQLGRKLHLSYILVKDAGDAQEIIKAVREGAVFSKVAAQKSLHASSRANGGDIGWVTYADLDPATREKVWSLKVGEVAGPFPWSGNYQIFKVDEEGVNEKRRSFEQERRNLEMGIAVERGGEARRKYVRALFDKYHFKIDPVQAAWMTALLREKTAGVKRGLSPEAAAYPLSAQMEADARPPWTTSPIAPADTGRVLATYDPPEGKVKPILVIDQLMTDPTIAWPKFESSGDVENLINSLVLERLELREAEARKLDKDPEVARKLTQLGRDVRRRVYYRTQVRAKAHPSEAVAKAYYDTHPAEYQQPERRRFVGVNSASWENVVAAGEMMRAGRSVDEIMARFAPKDTTFKSTGAKGTDPLKFGQSPMLDRFVFSLPMGGVSDPIPVGNSFTVAKVIEIQPAHPQPFSEVRVDIQSKIGAARSDSILKVILAEGRRKFPVRIDTAAAQEAIKGATPAEGSSSMGEPGGL